MAVRESLDAQESNPEKELHQEPETEGEANPNPSRLVSLPQLVSGEQVQTDLAALSEFLAAVHQS